MKKKVCSLITAAAVLLTTAGIPALAGEPETNGDSGVVLLSVCAEGSGEQEAGAAETVHVSAENAGDEDAVLRVFLESGSDGTPDLETEVINMCGSGEEISEEGWSTLDETMQSALTMPDGSKTALEAEWKQTEDGNGTVTERFLEAALPAGTSAAFDMQVVYRTDEAVCEKTSVVRAAAFVHDQDVTAVSGGASDSAEVTWKKTEDTAILSAASAYGSSEAERSGGNIETYRLNIADNVGTDYLTVPAVYYDYLDDGELTDGWKNNKVYGNSADQGWSVFGAFNGFLAQYYYDNQVAVPIYFGNLLRSDESTHTRAKQVEEQVKWLQDSPAWSNLPYNNSANNSNYLKDMYYSATGIVSNELSDGGNLQVEEGVNAPWFDEAWLTTAQEAEWDAAYGSKTPGKVMESEFAFRETVKDGVTYYEYDSSGGQDNITLGTDGSSFLYSQGTQYAVKDGRKNFELGDGGYGFFPFNRTGDETRNKIDYGFGAKIEIPFNLSPGGYSTDSSGNSVATHFDFTGDDDVWIFVDGKLVLDLGGAHKMAEGSINFKDGTVTVKDNRVTSVNSDPGHQTVSLYDALGVTDSSQYDPTVKHTLTIFYMERGMIESNLKIAFNMQPVTHSLVVEKDVDTAAVNSGLQETVEDADEFDISLSAAGTPASDKTYQLNGGEKKTDENGTLTLKDSEQALFRKQFDDVIGQTISAQESTVREEKSYLTYDASWKAEDLENGNALIAEGTGQDAAFTYNKTSEADNQFAAVRNKLTYINTPQTGSLSVAKETVDGSGSPYEDADTEFRFRILLDMGITTDGQTVSEDVTDPDAVYVRKPDTWDKIYVYCWNSSDTSEKNAAWPGVELTADDLVSGSQSIYKYDLGDNSDRYDMIQLNIGGNSAQSKDLKLYSSSEDPSMEHNYYLMDSSNDWIISQFQEKQDKYVPGESLGYQGYALSYQISGTGETRTADKDGYFTLKSGEKAVFTGIPVGTRFKIQEVSSDGYLLKSVTIGGAPQTPDADGYYSGSVQGQGTQTEVAVKNEKAQTAVNLSAIKTVDQVNKEVPTGAFQFILTGRAPEELGDGNWSKDTSGISQTKRNDGNGKAAFDTLTYQEEGVYLYTIAEVIPDDETYLYDRSEYEVRVDVSADGGSMQRDITVTKIKDKDGTALDPAEEVGDITSGIRFDNTTNTADLTVQKLLVNEDGTFLPKSSWPDKDSNFAFTFRLEMKNDSGVYEQCAGQTYYYNGGSGTTGSNGLFLVYPQESGSSVKVEFRDLIIGKEYRVTEVLTDKTGYELYGVTVGGGKADPSVSGRRYSVERTIEADGNDIVFSNYPLSSITIVKEDGENNPLAGASFRLEKETESGWEQIGEPQESGIGGRVYFSGLHAGHYRITEVKTAQGYVLLKEPIEIDLPYQYTAGDIVNGAEVTSDGLAYRITFTVINDMAFDLPQAGKNGTGLLLAAGGLIMITSGGMLLMRRRRKKA